MAHWTFLAADLRSNIVLGELPLTGVRMSKVINGAGQMAASIPVGDPAVAALDLHDMTRPARRVLYALRDNRPWWGGIIWSAGYDSDSLAINLQAVDFWSYFDHRKILDLLTLPAAPFYIAGLSRIYTQVDQNAIARDLVTAAQLHTGGNIGIVVDAAVTGILRDRTYEGFDLKDVGSALRDIAGLADGCDILFDVGPLDINGRPTRLMRTGTPFLAQPGASWRWELGGNMLSYGWDSVGGVMATREFAQGTGQDRGTQIAVAEDTARFADGWPLLETDDVYQTVSDFATLQDHANGQLDSLHLPLVTPKMRVRADLPPELDFSPGDFGQFVVPAGDPFLRDGVDLPVRVIGVTVDLDPQGNEAVEISCQPSQEVT